MTVEWGAVKACLICFSREGISVRLEAKDDYYICPRNPSHKFVFKEGALRRV